ncbi:MAG: Sensor kinase CusS [Bacteroidetes bacterium ADurb.Bin408]|nr:MAG: Sensor kinase CusS [Bacteroidetes bacterium ADurb.Bin408]
MKIRSRLTFQFSFIVSVTILFISLVVYVISANYRRNQFVERLENKAMTTVKLLVEIKQVDSLLLKVIESADRTILYKEKVVIIDPQDNIIFDSRENINFSYDKNLIDAIRQKKKIFDVQNGFEYVGLCYKEKGQEYIAIASAYDIFGINKLKNLRNILLLCFLFSVFLTIILGWFFAGKTLSPIKSMIQQVKNITSENLSARIDKSKNQDELTELAGTFNLMLDEVENSFNIQKQFVSNASHELKTPLTSIRSQIDVSLLSRRTPEEYENTLKSLSEDIKGLSETINNLLLLAQTSGTISNITLLDTRLDEIIWQAQKLVQSKKPYYKVKLNFSKIPEDTNELIIKANYVLLRNAFFNIMDNACKFSENHTVNVSINCSSKMFEIIFSDTGIGISQDDLKNLFKPFFRGSNVQNYKGHGIGMSLVKNIIAVHKGDISIDSEINKGTRIKLVFPKL